MFRAVKRGVVTVAGLAVVALGIVLLPLPGPGVLVIAAGLGILATEYVWARRALVRTRDHAAAASAAAVKNRGRTLATAAFAGGLAALGVGLLVFRDLPFAGPASGIGLIVGGLALMITTALGYRDARRRERPPTRA